MNIVRLRLMFIVFTFLCVMPFLTAQQNESIEADTEPAFLTDDPVDETSSNVRYTSSGLLSQETVYDNNGAERYTDFFRYTRDNRLRSVVRQYPDGTMQKTAVLSRNGKIALTRIFSGKEDVSSLQLLEYDEHARITGETVFSGKNETFVRRYSYADDATRPFNIQQSADDSTVQSVLDDNGKVTRTVRTSADNKLLEEVFFTYDESDRVTAKKCMQYTWQKRDEKTFELKFAADVDVLLYEYVYDEDGNVAKETCTKNGVVQHIVKYDVSECVSEFFFRNGDPFLKVFFSENKKVKEEYYRNGKPAGIRIFK